MSDNTKTHTDIKTGGFIDEMIPEKWRPFAYMMRLDRPIGWWLLLLPGWWSIALASGGISGLWLYGFVLMFSFFLGAVIMRGAGCVINDIWDRELDKKVERTQGRPLASGTVSVMEATVFLLVLLFIGAGILFTLAGKAILLGFGVLPLIALYPYMKRITYWPQAFLGITFNFGALMGWAAVHDGLSAPAYLLYLGGICWTIGYDTIYAHQDKEDDVMAGIKSTALKFGAQSKRWVAGFYGAAFVLFVLAILAADGLFSLSVVLLIIPAAHLGWQLKEWDIDDPESSLAMFKSNRDFGFLLLTCVLF